MLIMLSILIQMILKIKHLPNVLSFASKEHFEVASKANVLISTHDLENIVPYKTAARFWGYEDTIKVFYNMAF